MGDTKEHRDRKSLAELRRQRERDLAEALAALDGASAFDGEEAPSLGPDVALEGDEEGAVVGSEIDLDVAAADDPAAADRAETGLDDPAVLDRDTDSEG